MKGTGPLEHGYRKSFSLWLQNQVTDRANAGIRKRVVSFVGKGDTVLDIGCANGRLLFDLAPKISAGAGIDLDQNLIAYARHKAVRSNWGHLSFSAANALDAFGMLPFRPNVTIACLCLHEMGARTALKVLVKAGLNSDKLVIADFTEPDSYFQKALLHLDEGMAGHYRQFTEYLHLGGMPALIEMAGLNIAHESKIRADVNIWLCQKT